MCTLIVAFYPGTETPLVIGANRDEGPTRPAEDWKNRQNLNQFNSIVRYCPLDIPSNGTWIGVNVKGIFCAITNWDIEANKSKKSGGRGKLVYELLGFPNVEMAMRWLPYLKGKDYKPFNILIGDHSSLYLVSCDSKKIQYRKLTSGLYVSTGLGFNSGCVREQFARMVLKNSFEDFSQPVKFGSLHPILRMHNDGVGSEDSICVHDEEHRWETRSSCEIALYDNRWEIYRINCKPCDPEMEYVLDIKELEKKQ